MSVEFRAIVNMDIGNDRELIVSHRSDGDYSVAQRALLHGSKGDRVLMLRGALTVSMGGLKNATMALLIALIDEGEDVDEVLAEARLQLGPATEAASG